MKRIIIPICLLLFVIIDASAIGLDAKAMAMRTDLSKLDRINNLTELPIGLNAETYVNAKKSVVDDDAYLQAIQGFSIILALNLPIWDKYKIGNSVGNKISTLVPLLLMAQISMSHFDVDPNSIFLRNFIIGVWLGYYMNGYKDSQYKFKFSQFMVGVLATLYLNDYFSIANSAFLIYVTVKMGMILEKHKWSDGNISSGSNTSFGVFPAIGAEYKVAASLLVFVALGYNPFGIFEAGVRLNLNK